VSRQDRSLTTLARYTDPAGRPHRVVLSGHLLVDVSPRQRPRLVARLGEAEGEPQARALLDGSAIDEGYLARARREPRPFIRALAADDLRPHGSARASGEPETDMAAQEAPLAA
jgi:hypothetical protein